jgi:hypothetical protein
LIFKGFTRLFTAGMMTNFSTSHPPWESEFWTVIEARETSAFRPG